METIRHDEPGHSDDPLRFEACTLPLPDVADETIALHATISAGEFVLVETEDAEEENALTRAMCGRLSPLSGSVRFLGYDWLDLPTDFANALRGRIGTVFRNEGWVSYYSLLDNVVLPQLHHTRRPFAAIRDEATQWARRFGLPGLPSDLPAEASGHDRQCANLVRAFIGDPALILFEHRPGAFDAHLLPTLINAIRDARERDAVVIWFVQGAGSELERRLPVTRRIRIAAELNRASTERAA